MMKHEKSCSALWYWIVLLCMAPAWPTQVWAACSSELGNIVFNEVQEPSSGTTYLELRILDPNLVSRSSNFSGWTLQANRRPSGGGTVNTTTANLNTVFTTTIKNICGVNAAWIRVPDDEIGRYINNANPNYHLNFVLKDSSGNMVDLLRMASTGNFASFYSGAGSSCSTIETGLSSAANTKYDQEWGSNGNKDWYRSPDGSGTWGALNVQTSNNANSICNDNNATAPATLGLTKTANGANSTTVNVGDTVTFTLTAGNPLTGTNLTSATVTDVVPAGLTVNSGSCTISGGVSCSTSGNTVTWVAATSGSPLGVNVSRSATFTATAATAGTYTNTITANTTGSPSASASITVLPAASGFWAYESSISNGNAATTTNRVIQTRVASTSGTLCKAADGTTCTIRIAANNSGAVATTYSGTVSAQLQSCTNVSRSGSTVSCEGGWSNLGSAQSASLSSGVADVSFGFVNNAYEVVRVQISSAVVSGGPWNSDDNFAIRPTGLTVTATDGSASTAGSTRSLTDGTVSHRAGQPFTLNAQAYVGSASTTASNYRGTGAGPVVASVATTSPTGTGVVNGTLSVGSWNGSGTLTSSTASYTEVGTFTLELQDQDYANVDANDGSNTDRYFSGTAATVGRFTPDHFSTTVTPACGSGTLFTYSGQPFTVGLTALAHGSPAIPTLNYGLTTNTVTLSDVLASPPGAFSTTAPASATVASGLFSTTTGVATTAVPVYAFTNIRTSPYTLNVRATDADSISSSGFAEGSTVVRSGRVRLANAYGSELLDLPMSMRSEYWVDATSGWQPNTADTCTDATLNFAAVASPDITSKTCIWEATPLVSSSGPKGCVTAPSTATAPTARTYKEAAMVGFAGNFNLWLAAPGSGNAGALDVTATVPAWLQYPWTSTTPTSPVGRATFGIYKSPLIYRRENY